ncbi:AraC family transcriptional regulator [Pseudomonas asplenii]|uniref:AraC family transcriptional regulator n=1 Tax=Pseudomonas asplenii TaxID=53407 RepID=UPI00036F859A|nr:GyrI-like domain-containing protein [Pseudomonas fuscovaginae]
MSVAYQSLLEYTRRMNRVLEHIDQHLDQPLELAELAAIAYFSPFHFHRLFSAWVGETLGDYLRRRRLGCAALLLAERPEATVLEIALQVGFGSGEAFSRAFKQHFQVTPSAWRRLEPDRWEQRLNEVRERRRRSFRNPDQECASILYDHGRSQNLEEMTMDVTLEDIPPTRIAYMRYTGPYGPGIGTFWRETFAPWMEDHGLVGEVRFGIGHDDPHITPPHKCRYDACVQVPDHFTDSGAATVTTLPGGRYAVARFSGHVRDFPDAWTELCRDWLPRSGMQFASGPPFERYPKNARYDPVAGTLDCDLCIPVKPL